MTVRVTEIKMRDRKIRMNGRHLYCITFNYHFLFYRITSSLDQNVTKTSDKIKVSTGFNLLSMLIIRQQFGHMIGVLHLESLT